jgi:hypothetical protein
MRLEVFIFGTIIIGNAPDTRTKISSAGRTGSFRRHPSGTRGHKQTLNFINFKKINDFTSSTAGTSNPKSRSNLQGRSSTMEA